MPFDPNALRHHAAKLGHPTWCPACGHDQFTIADNLIGLPASNGQSDALVGHIMIAIAVCNRCHYIMQYLAEPLVAAYEASRREESQE